MNKLTIIKNSSGQILAEVLKSGIEVETSTFFSNKNSSLQIGFLAHKSGFNETIHFHKKYERKIFETSQVIFVQRGELFVDFFNEDKKKIAEINLKKGDVVNLIDGIHRIRVVEDCQCFTVKQGPFFPQNDKVEM